MTLSAALPGAALRVMRTAAGRRALQVVVLVGGLFALGFLCGEQAHAADGVVPTTPAQVVQSVKSSVKSSVTSSVEKGTSVPEDGSAALSTVVPVTDTAKHVTDTVRHVVRPVGDLVETVTDGLPENPPEMLPSLPGLPDPSDLPGLPALPGTGGQTPPAAGGSVPQGPAGATGQSHAAAAERGAGRRAAVEATPAYGPSGVRTDTGAGVDVRRDHDGVRAGQAPARQAPPGDPTGALVNQAAVGDGAPRHGDPHAVTSDHRAPLRLAPGASAVMTAAETRDRYRDIPVFPG
ncbi:hypothetical protein [Streptomyces sp. NBC_00203]|uniref:hypothetical protein n=1 Tax=Streptomyces sp. NBC_00203 TaxID=2975680 RepID=UPI00324399C0